MPDVNGRHRPLIVESRASSETGALICNSEKLLGSTYKAGNGIIGDYANVGFQIIDIEKVKALGNNRISSHYLKSRINLLLVILNILPTVQALQKKYLTALA